MEEVKIIPTQYGRGVSANRSWREGDIIRISECIYIPDNQMPLKSQGSALWAYVFSAAKEGVLVSLDWTSLMNHSEDDFNVEYNPTDDNKIVFKAARDINPGDELLINYGYDVVEHNKYFGIDTDKLNEDTLQGFDMSASQGGVGLSSVKIFDKKFDKIEDLLKWVNNPKRVNKIDCAVFGYLMEKSFPDVTLYYVPSHFSKYHIEVRYGNQFYEKQGDEPAKLMTEAEVNADADRRKTLLRIDSTLQNTPVYFVGGAPAFNELFIKKKLKEIDGMELIEALHDIRNVLFDAPDDVKEEFNQIVQYFAADDPKQSRKKAVQYRISKLQDRLTKHKYKDARNREADTLKLQQYQAELKYLNEYLSLAAKINAINK